MDRGWNIKDDIDSEIQPVQNKAEGETYARQLLEGHIKYITTVVKQLSNEIEVLQEQIRTQDYAIPRSNTVMKSLELHHPNGIGELRGRVARCDASIAKLTADMISVYEGIQNLSQEQQRAKLTLEAKIKDIEGQNFYRELRNLLESKKERSSLLGDRKVNSPTYWILGFSAIYDSIGSLKHILEAKMKQDKDKLQKQIHQIKQMMDLIPLRQSS
ncbi:hypothetical protein chiPu_0018822 [Chiloscyllium punctatum]|uniref:Uncharacterized protein n=1 Tax=Chiloscyllium punctatum TaxID=137246 RepID=A0A401RQ06_CHIPU|nr:hypothetical protein [Chiloscyllium punctatum]